MTTAFLHRRVGILDVLKIWFVSFFGNLAGMLFFMAIITGCKTKLRLSLRAVGLIANRWWCLSDGAVQGSSHHFRDAEGRDTPMASDNVTCDRRELACLSCSIFVDIISRDQFEDHRYLVAYSYFRGIRT